MGTYSGTYIYGIQLNSASQNPVTITQSAYIGNDNNYDHHSTSAVRGRTYAFDVINFGVIKTTNQSDDGDRVSLQFGIRLQDGGSVTNGTSGYIDATGAGVQIQGGTSGTVVNLGTIVGANPLGGSSDFTVPQGVGVGIGAGIVTNGSTLSHTASIAGNGIGVSVFGGTVQNFAQIEALPNDHQPGYYGSPGGGPGFRGTGVYARYGVVDNYQGGIIDGRLIGVAASGTNATIINHGTISASASDGRGQGIRLNQGGFVDNSGLVSGIAGGISSYSSFYGTIAATIGNSGTIQATGSSGVAIALTVGGATVANSGTISGAGGAVSFGGNGNHLVIDPGAVFLGTVSGGGINNTLELAVGDGSTGTFRGLGSQFTGFGAVSIDAGAKWRLNVAAAAFAGETITGNGGATPLAITTAGTADLSGVSGFPVLALDKKVANSIALTDANFTGTAGRITVTGGTAGNTVDASQLSAAHKLSFIGGAGADQVTGGAGNDAVKFTASTLSGSDAVAGGTGGDQLILTSAGTIDVSGVSGIETFTLSGQGHNALTLTDGNFAGATNNWMHVIGGSAGNTIDASAVSAPNKFAFTGGAGNDAVVVGNAAATLTGGGGTNQFTFADVGVGTHRIIDFGNINASNRLVLSDAGFKLGADEGLGTATPKHLAATVFIASGDGKFTDRKQRFAYNTTTGVLRYDPDGIGPGTGGGVAALSDHAALGAGATGNIFFTL